MIADASIHLTGILLLGPHLTEDNQCEILARARYRTKREIEKLVAELAPRNDVPTRIEPLHIAARPGADHATMMAALCGPVRNLEPGNARGQAPVGKLAELELASETAVPSRELAPPTSEPPLTPALHYRVQFTADQDYITVLEEARDLLAHVNPTRDIVEVQRRALELLVEQLRKGKHASRASAAPEPTTTPANPSSNPAPEPQPPRDADNVPTPHRISRRPTAAVARAVWARDQHRCTFIDDRGQRCRETSMLEYHHEHAWAHGGATTVDNLTLRCRAHNALAAEQDFGRAFMLQKRRGQGEEVATE